MGRVSAEPPCTIFLLSPAYCGGRRAGLLMRPGSTLALALRLNAGTLSLGEAFTFMSGLYFRGKMAYASAFGRHPHGAPASYVITPTRGLQSPDLPITHALVEEFAAVDVAHDEPRYFEPLAADARALATALPAGAHVVLLGSVATSKYVEVLAESLGARLHFPSDFVGRGDMSRGALMLQRAASGVELDYVVATTTTVRRGPRPPRLTPAASAPAR